MTLLKKIGKLGSLAVVFVAALSAAKAAAPVALDGWRYIDGGDSLHVFVCERGDCVPGSRVFCHVERRGSAVAPGIMRTEERRAAALAGEQFRPPTNAPSLGLDLAGGSRIIEKADDGISRYRTSVVVNNETSQFILVSSATDEQASRANLARFEKALQEISK
jgi:hypothetical protein